MGLRIDLPIHDLEEANFLHQLLEQSATQSQAWIDASHSTEEEKAEAQRKLDLARRLHDRMIGGS